MDIAKEFDHYLAYLMQVLGHANRHTGLTGYCTGLMLPLSSKSVESIAVRVDPLHASARHQSLHHLVVKAHWSDHEPLRRIAQRVVPLMDFSAGGWSGGHLSLVWSRQIRRSLLGRVLLPLQPTL